MWIFIHHFGGRKCATVKCSDFKISKKHPLLKKEIFEAFSHFSLYTLLKWLPWTFPLQDNRLVQSPFWMDGKMPSKGPVRLGEHCTLVNGSIAGYLVHREVVPSLELLSYMSWQALPGSLVVWMLGDVRCPLGIVEKFAARDNGIIPVECQQQTLIVADKKVDQLTLLSHYLGFVSLKKVVCN